MGVKEFLLNNSYNLISTGIGLIVGAIITYYIQSSLHKSEDKYKKRIELYESIFDELYQLEASWNNGNLMKLEKIPLIIKKSGLYRLKNPAKNLTIKLESEYKSFIGEFYELAGLTQNESHKYVDNAPYDEEAGYYTLPYHIPNEIIFGFLLDSKFRKEGNCYSTIVKYLKEVNEGALDYYGIDEEQFGGTSPSKRQIDKFYKIFEDSNLLKNSKNLKKRFNDIRKIVTELSNLIKNQF